MAEDSSPNLSSDPRVYFAAERTFLAWIRTGLALMGFGFVVARFGLFLRELSIAQPNFHVKSSRFSLWGGAALIVLGVIIDVASAIRHVKVVEGFRTGADTVARPSYTAIAVAVAMAIIGVAMVIYMFVMW
jgi:putative membrane protein